MKIWRPVCVSRKLEKPKMWWHFWNVSLNCFKFNEVIRLGWNSSLIFYQILDTTVPKQTPWVFKHPDWFSRSGLHPHTFPPSLPHSHFPYLSSFCQCTSQVVGYFAQHFTHMHIHLQKIFPLYLYKHIWQGKRHCFCSASSNSKQFKMLYKG